MNPSHSDTRNVQDKYKGWETDLIKEDLATKKHDFAVAMVHLGDFNFSTVIRSANIFGAKEVIYSGRKGWDRRGAVGTHHYTEVHYCVDFTVDERALRYNNWVALEYTDDAQDIRTFEWPDDCLIIVGDEIGGVPEYVLRNVNHVVKIPMFGSVRSLNVGSAASIAMYDFITKKG